MFDIVGYLAIVANSVFCYIQLFNYLSSVIKYNIYESTRDIYKKGISTIDRKAIQTGKQKRKNIEDESCRILSVNCSLICFGKQKKGIALRCPFLIYKLLQLLLYHLNSAAVVIAVAIRKTINCNYCDVPITWECK
jgi:hypothetical protein